jgi:hypothetical protein
MLTPKEYLDRFQGKALPKVVWMNGLELVEHVMAGDWKQTIHGDPNAHREHLYEVQSEMEAHAKDPDKLEEIMREGLQKKNRWKRFDDYSGDLDLDRYMQTRVGMNPVFDNFSKVKTHRPAMNILLDVAIPWMERGDRDMKARHEEVYKLTVQCQNENRPCRVIAANCISIPEAPRNIVFFTIIKDFRDPIFKGIWGAYKTNTAANSMLNVLADYFIGTSSSCNGCSEDINVLDHFQEGEVVLVKSKRLLMQKSRS